MPANKSAKHGDVYERFETLLYEANQLPEEHDIRRKEVFDMFNRDIAPVLIDEESFLQMVLYKMTLMHLREGQRVSCFVRQDLSGNVKGNWAVEYEIVNIVSNKQEGGVSFMLKPTENRSGICLLCFPGTGPCYKRDVILKEQYPRGVRDDVAWQGVGHDGYMANSFEWSRQVRQILDAGKEILLTGYSLGACYAAFLMSHFNTTASVQDNDRMSGLFFYPPGLSNEVLSTLGNRSHHLRIVHQRYDVTSLCGNGHLGGTVITTSDTIGCSLVPFQLPHAVPVFAIRRLLGEEPRCKIEVRENRYHKILAPIELGRKLTGIFFRPFLNA